jgi:23S rRNA (uracil1939-C5)-methyltransferase
LRIDSLAGGGRGVSRHDGLVWLVEGAVPGDRVLVREIRRRPRLVEAEVAEVVEPSPDRRRPSCALQPSCGGCSWMVLGEAEQRRWKRQIVVEALDRIGRLGDVPVDETVASPADLTYRNKVELTIARGADGEVAVGFHSAGGPARVVDVERCEVLDAAAHRTLDEARRFFVRGPGRDDPVLGDPRDPVRLVLRVSHLTGEVLIALRSGRRPFRSARDFARRMAALDEVSGVVRLLGRPGRRGGAGVVTLAGRPWIEESLGGTRFRLPAPVFFQVNTAAAEGLVERVRASVSAGASTSVVELYGGVGVYAIALARDGARVVVCEADAAAVACGRKAARGTGVGSVRFERSDVARFLGGIEREPSPDVVVANPPRTGFGRGVADGIVGLAPERIVIVSCDPATLARDLKQLTTHNYRTTRVTPIDLFPQTPHTETLTLLTRKGTSP